MYKTIAKLFTALILKLILVDIRYCYIKFIFVHPTLACTDLAAGDSSYLFLQEEQVDLAIFEQVSAESKHYIYYTIKRITRISFLFSLSSRPIIYNIKVCLMKLCIMNAEKYIVYLRQI